MSVKKRIPPIAKQADIVVPVDFTGMEDRLRLAAGAHYDPTSAPNITKANKAEEKETKSARPGIKNQLRAASKTFLKDPRQEK